MHDGLFKLFWQQRNTMSGQFILYKLTFSKTMSKKQIRKFPTAPSPHSCSQWASSATTGNSQISSPVLFTTTSCSQPGLALGRQHSNVTKSQPSPSQEARRTEGKDELQQYTMKAGLRDTADRGNVREGFLEEETVPSCEL